jgi:hypothetical protein
MAVTITRVHMPQTHIGLLDLVRALVPVDAGPEQTLMAVQMLGC